MQKAFDPEESFDGMGAAFEALLEVVLRLQAPDGCPWDLEQDVDSLFPYLLEEVWEAFETRHHTRQEVLLKELGDVFYTVLFMLVIADRKRSVQTVVDVSNFMRRKMITRHPHVFGEYNAETVEEAYAHWHAAKKKEGVESDGQRLKDLRKLLHKVFLTLESDPERFPALEQAIEGWCRATDQ